MAREHAPFVQMPATARARCDDEMKSTSKKKRKGERKDEPEGKEPEMREPEDERADAQSPPPLTHTLSHSIFFVDVIFFYYA